MRITQKSVYSVERSRQPRIVLFVFSGDLANSETAGGHQQHNEYDPDMLFFSAIRFSRIRRDILNRRVAAPTARYKAAVHTRALLKD
jgi:hypothetical protein